MIDREKVIADLRGFINYPEPLSGTIKDALELLKEQEPVKPIVEQYALPLTNTSVRFIKKHYCGICKEEITGNNVYCHKCGRRVKWDDQ